MEIFNNFTFVIGLIMILYSIIMYSFPPAYGNYWYGITTKVTMENNNTWATAQRLFACALFIIGFVFSVLGYLKLEEKIHPFPMVILFIGLWGLAKKVIHKKLENKYPTGHNKK